jgi:hypothetical protein
MSCEGTGGKLSAKLSTESDLGETLEVPAKTPVGGELTPVGGVYCQKPLEAL